MNHKMHYFKQQRQSKGWKGDFYVFEKKNFLLDFYIPNKNNIPNDLITGIEFFKSSLSKYIKNRNTQSIFQTKFMDISTENNIDYELTSEDKIKNADISKTTLIENKFEKFLNNKSDNQNPKFLQHASFTQKDLNLDDLTAYFSLQCSRTPLNLFAWFDDFTKEFPFEYTKEYALKFREFYNKQYLLYFSIQHKYFTKNINNILFVPMEISVTNPKIKSLISVGEFNTINLLQYKNFAPSLNNYSNDLLKNIYMTVVSSNCLYFCIIVPPRGKKTLFMYFENIIRKYKNFPYTLYECPRELLFYEDMLLDVQSTWNSFSLFSAQEHLICSNEEEAKNFMAEQLYISHRNNKLEEQFTKNEHISQLLSLEDLL